MLRNPASKPEKLELQFLNSQEESFMVMMSYPHSPVVQSSVPVQYFQIPESTMGTRGKVCVSVVLVGWTDSLKIFVTTVMPVPKINYD